MTSTTSAAGSARAPTLSWPPPAHWRPGRDIRRPRWPGARCWHGWFTFHLGGQQEAKALLERSLAILRDRSARGELIFPLNYVGAVESYLGNTAQTDVVCQVLRAHAGEILQRTSLSLSHQVASSLGETR